MLSPDQNYSHRTYYRDERDRIYAWQKTPSNTYNPKENGRGERYRYDEEGQLADAWHEAPNPVTTADGALGYEGFNYDALGNRQQWNYLATKGWLNFTRKDNGLNQYRGWWNYSITNYDDDIGGTWGSPQHANEGTEGVRAKY